MSKLLLNVIERCRENCLQKYWHSIDFWFILSQLAEAAVNVTTITTGRGGGMPFPKDAYNHVTKSIV